MELQDTNGNGDLDRGLFGPIEQWGMSWKVKMLFRISKSADIVFDVYKDINGVEINMRQVSTAPRPEALSFGAITKAASRFVPCPLLGAPIHFLQGRYAYRRIACGRSSPHIFMACIVNQAE